MPWCRESKHREILNRRAKVQIKAENLASFKVFLIKKPCCPYHDRDFMRLYGSKTTFIFLNQCLYLHTPI